MGWLKNKTKEKIERPRKSEKEKRWESKIKQKCKVT